MLSSIELEELRKILRQMETSELLSRYRRGLFTDEALPSAVDELRSRNIDVQTIIVVDDSLAKSGLVAQILDGFRGLLSLERAFWGGLIILLLLTMPPVFLMSDSFGVDMAAKSLPMRLEMGWYSIGLACWLFVIYRCKSNTHRRAFSIVAARIAEIGAISVLGFFFVSVFT